MDPNKRTNSHTRFRAASDDTINGLSYNQDTATNEHWSNWAAFCKNVTLNPLLISYRDLVPVLYSFVQQYRNWQISPIKCPVRSQTDENTMHSICQALAALGANDPRLARQGKLDIRLRFQLCCFKKRDTSPSRANPTPLQVLWNIVSVTIASGEPILQSKSDMIILKYFFLLRTGDYTGYKSKSTPF